MGVLVVDDGKLTYKIFLSKEKLISELLYNKIAEEKCDMNMPNICFSKSGDGLYEVIYIYNVPANSSCMQLTYFKELEESRKYYQKKNKTADSDEIKSLEELDDITYKLYSSKKKDIIFDSKRKLSKDASKIIALDFLLNKENRSSNSIDVCSSEEKIYKIIGSRENYNLFSNISNFGISKFKGNSITFDSAIKSAYSKDYDRTYFEDFKKFYVEYYQNITTSYLEDCLFEINDGYNFNDKELCLNYSASYVKTRHKQTKNLYLLK